MNSEQKAKGSPENFWDGRISLKIAQNPFNSI